MSDFDLNLLQGGRRVAPFDDDEPETDDAAGPEPASAREGLPPAYRMRADAHYVDALTSTRPASPAVLAPDPRAADEAAHAGRTQRVLDRLRADLTTIQSVAALSNEDASPMARRLHLNLLQAESWRCLWLVEANAILGGHHRAEARPRQLGPILEWIRQGFAAESRISNVPLQVRASDWSATVMVDEPAVRAAIAGALFATLGLLGGRDASAPIRVSVEALNGELRTVEVAQDDVEPPAAAGLRFFDADWVERPGGWIAAMGAATARAVARQHGGHAALLAGERRGTLIRLNLTPAH